ncbi:MAG: DUF1599 domain-containing protein, partial [Prevotellaceae bacterium]|nr:DUF1599 domain-containing protein [Prevotellaceae bacterium]
MNNTLHEFDEIIKICRSVFEKKLNDYGTSWRIMRPQSVTDQIFIKANRIRSIEIKGEQRIDEDIRSELIAIVNYGIIGLIQLEHGFADTKDMSNADALILYNNHTEAAKKLMMNKNHDYDEAWRLMRTTSYT